MLVFVHTYGMFKLLTICLMLCDSCVQRVSYVSVFVVCQITKFMLNTKSIVNLLYSLQHSFILMTAYISYDTNYIYRNMNLQMSYELHRLYSFNNSLWKPLPGRRSASLLARIGFYYSGNEAIVICYKCSCKVDCSEPNESLTVKHRELSPSCLLVIGIATDNVLLIDPEEVVKRFSADSSLLDTSDKEAVQTAATTVDSSPVEVSKRVYAIFVQAYSRSQRRGVFPNTDAETTAVDRNNPDFDRLR